MWWDDEHGSWWGQMDGKTKMTWLSWDKVCTPNKEGGLGFRDLKAFNLALLAKQGWWLQTNMSSLAHRVLKARYFQNSDFLRLHWDLDLLFAWRSIMAMQKFFEHGYRWQVGNGTSIGIWTDKWLHNLYTFKLISPPNNTFEFSKASDLIDTLKCEWQTDLVRQNFLPPKHIF